MESNCKYVPDKQHLIDLKQSDFAWYFFRTVNWSCRFLVWLSSYQTLYVSKIIEHFSTHKYFHLIFTMLYNLSIMFFKLDSDGMELFKCHSFLSLRVYIVKCLTKPHVIRNGAVVKCILDFIIWLFVKIARVIEN